MEVNDDVPYKVNNLLLKMHRNRLQLQLLHQCNKMMLDHNDDVDQKNEMEYIHVDDDGDHAMMR
jgi:hypothetical protein